MGIRAPKPRLETTWNVLRMAPISVSVARCWRRLRALSLSCFVGCALWGITARAQASQSVVVYATSATLESLVGRLCAELASADYAVDLELSTPPSECEQSQRAW